MHVLLRLACCSSRASEGTCWACSAWRWTQQQDEVIARLSAGAPPPEDVAPRVMALSVAVTRSLTRVLLTAFGATTAGATERSVRMNSNCVLLHLQDPHQVQPKGCQEQHVARYRADGSPHRLSRRGLATPGGCSNSSLREAWST